MAALSCDSVLAAKPVPLCLVYFSRIVQSFSIRVFFWSRRKCGTGCPAALLRAFPAAAGGLFHPALPYFLCLRPQRVCATRIRNQATLL